MLSTGEERQAGDREEVYLLTLGLERKGQGLEEFTVSGWRTGP